MAIQSVAPPSRRQILVAALGALGALGGMATTALVRPARTSATTGDSLVLGTDNTADATTRLTSTIESLGAPALDIATAEYGTGLHVSTPSGHGVRAWLSAVHPEPERERRAAIWAGADTDSTALDVDGRARFSRSGRAEIAAGLSSITVEVPGYFQPTSFALATLNTNRPGVWVRGVFLERTPLRKNRLTIYLNKPTPYRTRCAWIVLN